MQIKIIFIVFFLILGIVVLYDLIKSMKSNKYKKVWILILVDLGLIISIFTIVYLSIKLNQNIDIYSLEFSNTYLLKSYMQVIGLIFAIIRILFVNRLKKNNVE